VTEQDRGRTGVDAGSAVKAVLDDVADFPEGREPHPAGLDGAGTGHAVTLAVPDHQPLHRLKKF